MALHFEEDDGRAQRRRGAPAAGAREAAAGSGARRRSGPAGSAALAEATRHVSEERFPRCADCARWQRQRARPLAPRRRRRSRALRRVAGERAARSCPYWSPKTASSSAALPVAADDACDAIALRRAAALMLDLGGPRDPRAWRQERLRAGSPSRPVQAQTFDDYLDRLFHARGPASCRHHHLGGSAARSPWAAARRSMPK